MFVDYVRFSREDVEYLMKMTGISEDEAIAILDKAESLPTSFSKDEVLDLFVSPPEKWEDFVRSLNLDTWRFDKEYVEFPYLEHDFGEEIGIVVDLNEEEDFSYVGELPDGEIIYFGEFAKVDIFGDIYCAVERSKRIRTEDIYVPVYWSSVGGAVIKYVEDYIKELEEAFKKEFGEYPEEEYLGYEDEEEE
jgi:hypothetical protein